MCRTTTFFFRTLRRLKQHEARDLQKNIPKSLWPHFAMHFRGVPFFLGALGNVLMKIASAGAHGLLAINWVLAGQVNFK